jgi:hypothetical protein
MPERVSAAKLELFAFRWPTNEATALRLEVRFPSTPRPELGDGPDRMRERIRSIYKLRACDLFTCHGRLARVLIEKNMGEPPMAQKVTTSPVAARRT